MTVRPLSWYPRPPDDTGFGLHGSASNSFGGLLEHKDANPALVAELKRRGVRWMKLVAGGDNCLETSALLLANGIMPIIRFYVAEQWPRPLSACVDLADLVRAYVAVGVRYFQTGNEPNLLLEWQRGWGSSDEDPTEWKKGAQPDRVADAFAIDARIILDNGGIPLTAPLAPGGNYNDIDWFRTYCQVLRNKGHAGLLQEGIAIGAHPGTLNHPLDYPFDKVNQEGEQLTREEYERHSTWAGSLEWVNAERLRGKNSGQHLQSVFPPGHELAGKDSGGSNCWLKWRAYHDVWVEVFGFEVPIISLEGGVWVGEKLGPEPFNDARIYDPRYPAVSKERHKEWILAILHQFSDGQVPEYLFNVMFWLGGGAGWGGQHQPFERDAWWSHYWEGGRLPVVDALLASPALPRKPYQGTDSTPVEPVTRTLTFAEVAALTEKHGFVGEERVIMTALVDAESRRVTTAVGQNLDAAGNVLSEDLGPGQVNGGWVPDLIAAGIIARRADLFDPDMNMAACRYVYLIQGFGAWCALDSERYEKALPKAQEAVDAMDAAKTPTPEQLRRFAWESCSGVPEDAALMKRGRELGLVPICGEGRDMIGCAPYVGQLFTDGQRMVLLYCRDGQWDTVYQEDL